ncbi:antibiotic biosynthesis monooxygenase family protein [Marinobacteraceae bacterium S3BR75-40.1]
MSLRLVIHFEVKEDKLASFHTLMLRTRETLPQVEGCMGVEIFNSPEDPTRFMLIEAWESRLLHDRYFQYLERSGAWGHLISHLKTDPTSQYFEEFGNLLPGPRQP